MTIDRRVPRRTCAARLVVVVSGSYGAGHDAAAAALRDQLAEAGYQVRHLDVAEELPCGLGRALRWVFFVQLRLLPASWGTTVRLLQHDGVATRAVRRALGLLGRRLVRRVDGADLVISTHPLASQALGEARARGRLATAVVTYLTDASAHRLWVHPAVDLHLAIHEITAAQSRQLGGRTSVVVPVVARRTRNRAGWQPPWVTPGPTALVVGGSCGIGELEATARDVLATGLMTPVVACGGNERLRQRLSALPGVVALGWRADMGELVAHADCVLQNAGGMTSLEALAAGTPTFTYRPIAGHGITNAQVLDAAGLVPWLRGPAELAASLAEALATPPTPALPHRAPSVVDVLRRAGLRTEATVDLVA